jgi:hypothetical protein
MISWILYIYCILSLESWHYIVCGLILHFMQVISDHIACCRPLQQHCDRSVSSQSSRRFVSSDPVSRHNDWCKDIRQQSTSCHKACIDLHGLLYFIATATATVAVPRRCLVILGVTALYALMSIRDWACWHFNMTIEYHWGVSSCL